MEKSIPDHPEINIIVPLFNEEVIFDTLIERLTKLMHDFEPSIEVILVDDGSNDNTAEKMKQLALNDPRFHAIILSRNFGQQLAFQAGLQAVNANEAILLIDGDLQDPPELINQFYTHLKEGYDVVYAVRRSRKSSVILKFSYWLFYRIMRKFSYIDIPLDSSNFSLMSRRVVDHINSMPEESRYLSGLRTWVGFKQKSVPFDREERKSGTSKYGWGKLVSLALTGIFNFSKYPIRFTMSLGVLAFTTSLIYFGITLYKKIFIGDVPIGFTALLFTIIAFGGLQLIAIGVIGEYVLRIFFQVKNRPLFIVKERIRNGKINQ
jgi:dolichol-phosphate mannosyltransferase